MEQKICQCCAMPIDETTFGTEADGSKNEEYCQYCYADGHFTKECTMDEMIELNLNYLEEFNKDYRRGAGNDERVLPSTKEMETIG